MSIAIHAGSRSYELGSVAFLKAFFSTVYVVAERRAWGAVFPTLMNQLYQGRVEPEQLSALAREVGALRATLARHSPSEIVWDFETPSAQPPWGTNIASSITSLANYFVTSSGNDLLGVLEQACSEAARRRVALSLE
jgi:2,3-bisphosphoglycerate-dependent phosphoglycerate mutase